MILMMMMMMMIGDDDDNDNDNDDDDDDDDDDDALLSVCLLLPGLHASSPLPRFRFSLSDPESRARLSIYKVLTLLPSHVFPFPSPPPPCFL